MKKPQLPAAVLATNESPAVVPVGVAKAAVLPTCPAQWPAPAEYVDPFLFEIGFYASRAEYKELIRTAPILSRAEVEEAPRRKRQPRPRK